MEATKLIVVGVDESEGSGVALTWAVAEAAARGASVRAVLAWTYLDQPAVPGEPRGFVADFDEHAASDVLATILRVRLGDAAGIVERVVSNDHAGPALVRHSDDSDLLVVGARGLGALRAAALGSISNYCLHHATIPVAVIGPEVAAAARTGPVVVGTDGSEPAKAAVAWAAAEAAARDRDLQVLVAWNVPAVMAGPVIDPTPFEDAAQDVLAKTLADVPDAVGRVSGEVVLGGAATVLVEASRTASLTVVGSRGRGGFRSLLLGSTSHQLATHAHGPVVVVTSAREPKDQRPNR